MSNLTLHRSGEFLILDTSTNQCRQQGHRTFKYKLKIKSNTILDERGFVIAHEDVDRAVMASVKDADSCEMLCIKIANTVCTMLIRQRVSWRKITVEIHPQPTGVAYMKYTMRAPKIK